VHRAVLCAKSPVFTTMFEGGYAEAVASKVDMTGEDPVAVAALVEHIYTGALCRSADPLVLLPLADRYEIHDCVADCGEALARLAKHQPAAVLRVLRPYSCDQRLQSVWDRVCNVVIASRELTLSVFLEP